MSLIRVRESESWFLGKIRYPYQGMVVEKVVNKTMKTYTTTRKEEWSEKLLDENSGMIKTFNDRIFFI